MINNVTTKKLYFKSIVYHLWSWYGIFINKVLMPIDEHFFLFQLKLTLGKIDSWGNVKIIKIFIFYQRALYMKRTVIYEETSLQLYIRQCCKVYYIDKLQIDSMYLFITSLVILWIINCVYLYVSYCRMCYAILLNFLYVNIFFYKFCVRTKQVVFIIYTRYMSPTIHVVLKLNFILHTLLCNTITFLKVCCP